MRFAVDTGGTFTDLIVDAGDGTLRMYKAPTMAEDPASGMLAAFRLAAEDWDLDLSELLSRGELLVHGTTIGTNAILTGDVAKTAFLTTHGHPDILVLREAGRAGISAFDYSVPSPRPYIPRALTYEVPERVAADGTVVEPLSEDAVVEITAKLARQEIEAVGVCLLWSIVNPVHERRVGQLLDRHLPGVPYTLSHEVNPSLREYRRASSTCIDASLKPRMSGYLHNLSDRLEDAGFRGRLLVVTAQGGALDAEDVARSPIHSIKSGPAMAPVAGRHFASVEFESDAVIVADTGGTSYDVSLVRGGRIPWTRETWIGRPYLGHMTGFPSVDVQSVGAGGGSIAWVDHVGLLHVGPQSAGSVPGPACYARGGVHPTVTDAALTLGYFDPDYFLGGRIGLDCTAAKVALEGHVAARLDLDLHEAAAAVMHVVTENMVAAIEDITINQGIDPRRAVLVGGGGAAGLNSVAIARRLGCRQVLIPELSAALSAAGGLLSELSAEYAGLFPTSGGQFDMQGVNRMLTELNEKCRAFADGQGTQSLRQSIQFAVEARYVGQIWEIEVPLRVEEFGSEDDVQVLMKDFHALHRDLFAIDDPSSDVEFIMWRTRVSCALGEHAVHATLRTDPNAGRVANGTRPVFFLDYGMVDAKVIDVQALSDEISVSGPAIVESPFTTVVIDPGASAQRTHARNVLISLQR